MRDQVVGVQVAVAVREHHALRARRRARGVVERDHVVLAARDGAAAARRTRRATSASQSVQPGRDRGAGRRRAIQCFTRRRASRGSPRRPATYAASTSATVHARVVQDVLVVRGGEPVVERHEDRADPARARRSSRGSSGSSGERMQTRSPCLTPRRGARARAGSRALQLAVGEAQVAVHDRGLVGIELRRAAQEIVDEERNFHRSAHHDDAAGDLAGASARRTRRSPPSSLIRARHQVVEVELAVQVACRRSAACRCGSGWCPCSSPGSSSRTGSRRRAARPSGRPGSCR